MLEAEEIQVEALDANHAADRLPSSMAWPSNLWTSWKRRNTEKSLGAFLHLAFKARAGLDLTRYLD